MPQATCKREKTIRKKSRKYGLLRLTQTNQWNFESGVQDPLKPGDASSQAFQRCKTVAKISHSRLKI
jgi:hypothetical protein